MYNLLSATSCATIEASETTEIGRDSTDLADLGSIVSDDVRVICENGKGKEKGIINWLSRT